MSYVIVHAVILLFCLSRTVQCNQMNKVNWLMEGELYTSDRFVPMGVEIETKKMYFPVSTRVDITYGTKNNSTITCIIAAAIHMKGWVSIVDGGLNSQSVKLRYITENSEPDVFFVLVQSTSIDTVVIEGNIARSSRYGIVYEPVRNWTEKLIQKIMREREPNVNVP